MTPTFFDTFERRGCLLKELQEWLGTPFVHRAHIKQAGIDCVQLIGQVMTKCGVVGSYDFGNYPLDWGEHRADSLIVQYIEGTHRFAQIIGDTELGDIICFRVGRCAQHCGIAIDELHFEHVLVHGRVTINQLDDITWRSRVACIYRPLP